MNNKIYKFHFTSEGREIWTRITNSNKKLQHLQQKFNYTWRTCTWKTVLAGSPTRSSATGPTHLERGQLIFKMQKKTLTINIVGWLFSRLVWNRPSTSGNMLAHWHKTKTPKTWDYCGPAPPLARLQQSQLIWKGARSSGKYKNER